MSKRDVTTVPCGREELFDLHALRADVARLEGRSLRSIPLGEIVRKLIDSYRATTATEGNKIS